MNRLKQKTKTEKISKFIDVAMEEDVVHMTSIVVKYKDDTLQTMVITTNQLEIDGVLGLAGSAFSFGGDDIEKQ